MKDVIDMAVYVFTSKAIGIATATEMMTELKRKKSKPVTFVNPSIPQLIPAAIYITVRTKSICLEL